MCGYGGPCRKSRRKMKESKEGHALFAVFETGSATSHRKLVRTKPLSYTKRRKTKRDGKENDIIAVLAYIDLGLTQFHGKQ